MRETTDNLTLRGEMRLVLRDEKGRFKARRVVKNLIVTVGKNDIMDQLLASPTLGKPTHMAVGTGAVAAAAGDTTLGAESARVALTSKTRATNVLTMVGDYAAGVATAALTEAGVLTAASAGDLYSRAVFAAINKGANDTLKITWTYTGG